MSGTSDPLVFFQSAIEQQIKESEKRSTDHGWAFLPRDLAHHTIGDLICAILSIDTPEAAQSFFDGYVLYIRQRWPQDDAPAVARSNIGWCFGEGMTTDRREMWIQVCGASHPVFGQSVPNLAQALEAGQQWAKETP